MEMFFNLALGTGIAIIIIAFLAEYMDSTIGMGYGTTLTPILLLMGFEPLAVVPAILLSELVTGLLAGFTHHSVGNVDFRPKTMNIKKIINALKEYSILDCLDEGLTLHLKIVLILFSCSMLGTIAAVLLAINLPKFYLKLYIGILVAVIGIIIIVTVNKKFKFSWKRVVMLGVIASFNKGLSGGGYGPVITGGQLLAGVEGKNAVGITSLAEGLTCLTGVICYFLTKTTIDWTLAPYLIIGGIFSVPLSAYTVRMMRTATLKIIIGIGTIFLGLVTLGKLIF